MRDFLKRASFCIGMAGIGVLLSGWDTWVTKGTPWQSIYQTGTPESIPEHSNNSDLAFKRLNSSGDLLRLFGREGSAKIIAVDINASHFRDDTLYLKNPYGDNGDTLVEERLIPPPGLFAGLPDYSYALYDWLNKNKTCPAFQSETYTPLCHDFIGWLGGLNSVHFGSQARKMYAHHHENALALANRAKQLRDAMSKEERVAYKPALLEAEHQALAYEGYAQHFLQDRWAIGHMWERWGSPDTSQVDKNLVQNVAIGAVAGLIHGAEAVVSQGSDYGAEYFLMRADPMSSPLPAPDTETGAFSTAIPMDYVHDYGSGTSASISGIGDERLQDALDGVFRLPRYDPSRSAQYLHVEGQMEDFQDCAAAGWAEVIRTFGSEDKAGVYGAYEAPIDSNVPSFAVMEKDDCWNMWATNKSMVTGLLGPNPGGSIALLGSANIVINAGTLGIATIDPIIGGDVGNRTELLTHATRMWLYGRTNPYGTDIAKGEMTTAFAALSDWVAGETEPTTLKVWGFDHGGHFEKPDYVEPVGLITDNDETGSATGVQPLPWRDVRGRDVQTLFGVFNQAHSDYWCENRETLDELRQSGDPKDIEICQRLADFSYQGTHPSYRGQQARTRKADGMEIGSLCKIHDKGVESQDNDDQDNPYWLDPGYTPYDKSTEIDDEFTKFTTFVELANWCAKAPVIKLHTDPELNAENVALRISPDASSMTLVGIDFGDTKGTVSAKLADGEKIIFDTILDWTDKYIQIDLTDLTDLTLEEGQDYQLEVSLPTGIGRTVTESVGLFYLRVIEQEDAPQVRQVLLDLGGVGPCGDPVPEFDFIDLHASMPSSGDGDTIKKLLKTYRKDMTELKPYLEKQLQCMKALRLDRMDTIDSFFKNYPEKFYYAEGGLNTFARDAPYLPITHPSEQLSYRASRPELSQADFNYIQTSALIDGSDIWEGDIYTTHIDDLAGIIQFLGKTELLLEAWVKAYSIDDAFISVSNRSISMAELFAAADDLDGMMEAGFVDLNENRNLRKILKSRSRRKNYEKERWNKAQVDLGTTGLAFNDLLQRISVGLGAWTQAQHTLTQVIIPETNTEIDQLEIELKRGFRKRRAEIFAACSPNQEPCENQSTIGGDMDFDQLHVLVRWLSDLYNETRVMSPLFIRMTETNGYPVIRNFGYVDENGLNRHFIGWPSQDALEVARNRPSALK